MSVSVPSAWKVFATLFALCNAITFLIIPIGQKINVPIAMIGTIGIRSVERPIAKPIELPIMPFVALFMFFIKK